MLLGHCFSAMLLKSQTCMRSVFYTALLKASLLKRRGYHSNARRQIDTINTITNMRDNKSIIGFRNSQLSPIDPSMHWAKTSSMRDLLHPLCIGKKLQKIFEQPNGRASPMLVKLFSISHCEEGPSWCWGRTIANKKLNWHQCRCFALFYICKDASSQELFAMLWI